MEDPVAVPYSGYSVTHSKAARLPQSGRVAASIASQESSLGATKPSVLPVPLLQQSASEQVQPLPSCLMSICPDEVQWFQRLEKINAAMNDAIARQQLLLHEAWEHFSTTADDANKFGSGRGVSTQTLRVHVYNTHHNQATGNPELDTFSTTDLTDTPPPRWTLRLQGRLVNVNGHSSSVARNTLRMTSFFERIVISRAEETLVWDRSSQAPQRIFEAPCKQICSRLVAQQQAKMIKLNASSTLPSGSGYSPIGGTTDVVRGTATSAQGVSESRTSGGSRLSSPSDESGARKASSALAEDVTLQQKTCALIDAAVSDTIVRQLVDCDGIELSRSGDQEEDVEIVLFPAYRSPHFRFSDELSGFMGTAIGSLSQVIRVIWLRSRALASGRQTSVPNLTELPCDERLQQVLGVTETTYNFYELPTLLAPHLHPVAPITLKHRIRVSGDYVDNESIYDIQVDTLDTLYPISPTLAPWLSEPKDDVAASDKGDLDVEHKRDQNDHGVHDDTITAILSELAASRPNLPQEADGVPGTQLPDTILEVWESLLAAVGRRNLLLQFARNPRATMHTLLTASHVAPNEVSHPFLHENFLKEYELGDLKAEFYSQPWATAAVDVYLENKRRNFDELVGRVLTLSNVERRIGEAQDAAAASDSQRHDSRTSSFPLTSTDIKPTTGSTTRVPVFTQMTRQVPFPSGRYNYPSPQQFGRYMIPNTEYNPYFQSYSAHLHSMHEQQSLPRSSPLGMANFGQPAAVASYNISLTAKPTSAADWGTGTPPSPQVPQTQLRPTLTQQQQSPLYSVPEHAASGSSHQMSQNRQIFLQPLGPPSSSSLIPRVPTLQAKGSPA